MIAERLTALRNQHGIKTKKEASRIFGMPYTTYNNYETGARAPGSEELIKFANYYDVTIDYLLGLSDNPNEKYQSPEFQLFSHPDILPIKTKKIPLLGDISCGEPIIANQEYDSYVEVGTEVRADFAVRAKGDSMTPRIEDGDIVFVREQPMVDNGQVAVVVIEDEVTLKRVRKLEKNSTIMLVPDNPAHGAILLNDENQNVQILGRAIAIQRDVK